MRRDRPRITQVRGQRAEAKRIEEAPPPLDPPFYREGHEPTPLDICLLAMSYWGWDGRKG